MKKKFRILMIGPCYGYNVEKWVKYFHKNSDIYDFTVITNYFGYDHELKSNITLFQTNVLIGRLIVYFKLFFKESFDICLIHSVNPQYLSILDWIFIRSKKFAYFIWGESIIRHYYHAKFVKRFLIKLLFFIIDYINFGNFNILDEFLEKESKFFNKCTNYFWGVDSIFFEKLNNHGNDFTSDFLTKYQDNIIIFYPRSILSVSRFDLVIEAMNIIKTKHKNIIKNVKLIIWEGNSVNNDYKNYLLGLIKKYNLTDEIIFQQHPPLDINDFKILWRRSDFSMNIIENDGFSSQVSEAFIFKKPIIISKINAYLPLNKFFNLHIDFVDLNSVSIADMMVEMLKKYKTYNNDILERRRKFAEKYLDFSRNFYNLLKYYLSN